MANSQDYKYVKGISDLSATLQALPDDMRSKILVAGVKRACKPIEVAAKRFAKRSERTGALREALTTKTVNYLRSGKAVGLVGPDRGYYHKGKRVGKLGAILLRNDRPSNYAHLVEYGHRAVAPIKGTSLRKGTAKLKPGKAGWVPAKPFIRPAVQTTTNQQSDEFYAGIADGYEATRKRLVKEGAHSA